MVEATSPKLVLSFAKVAEISAKLNPRMGQNFSGELYLPKKILPHPYADLGRSVSLERWGFD